MDLTGAITVEDTITSVELTQHGVPILNLGFDKNTLLIDVTSAPGFDIDVEDFNTAIRLMDLWFRRVAKIPLTGACRPFSSELKRSDTGNKIEATFSFTGTSGEFTHEFDEDTEVLSVSTQPTLIITPVEFLFIFDLFRHTLLLRKFPRP